MLAPEFWQWFGWSLATIAAYCAIVLALARFCAMSGGDDEIAKRIRR